MHLYINTEKKQTHSLKLYFSWFPIKMWIETIEINSTNRQTFYSLLIVFFLLLAVNRTQLLHADMSFHGSDSVKHYLSIPRARRMRQQHASSLQGLLTLQSTLASWHWQSDKGGQTDQGCRKDSCQLYRRTLHPGGPEWSCLILLLMCDHFRMTPNFRREEDELLQRTLTAFVCISFLRGSVYDAANTPVQELHQG